MKITLDMFKAVCIADQITPEFLSIVSGMGQKKAAVDEHFMTCYATVSPRRHEGDSCSTAAQTQLLGTNQNSPTVLDSYG